MEAIGICPFADIAVALLTSMSCLWWVEGFPSRAYSRVHARAYMGLDGGLAQHTVVADVI